jgi:serine phosphatase RsbU (regulator of sigma subunit)
VYYSGAKMPAILVRDGEVHKYDPNRTSIGMKSEISGDCFKQQEIEIRDGDMIYLFSDGYIDQFGGPTGKKFMMSRFRELLQKTSMEPVLRQKEIMEEVLAEWQGRYDQVDDITVMGIRITGEIL